MMPTFCSLESKFLKICTFACLLFTAQFWNHFLVPVSTYLPFSSAKIFFTPRQKIILTSESYMNKNNKNCPLTETVASIENETSSKVTVEKLPKDYLNLLSTVTRKDSGYSSTYGQHSELSPSNDICPENLKTLRRKKAGASVNWNVPHLKGRWNVSLDFNSRAFVE